MQSISSTLWIGDKAAYERFREYEARQRKNFEHGRAINAVLFADDLNQSPGSNLYSVMRNVVSDKTIPSVGGFISVVSSRDNGFRFSVYSDMLFDWPKNESEDYVFNLNDPISLSVLEDENLGYSIAQISPGYMGVNLVAFYLTKGKKLFIFHGTNNGLANKCRVLSSIEAQDIPQKLNEFAHEMNEFSGDPNWLALVTIAMPMQNNLNLGTVTNAKGVRMGFMPLVNTFPKP